MNPNCPYTRVYTLKNQDNTLLSTIFSSNTQPGYTVISNSIADAGTYSLKLSMTLANYPAAFTPYEDATLTWTVTVVDPCTSAESNALNNFASSFDAMTASILGAPQYQAYSHPTDKFSASNDVIKNYYAVPKPYSSGPTYSTTTATAASGTNICGSRSYVITPTTCQAYLTVDTTTQSFPILVLAPTLTS